MSRVLEHIDQHLDQPLELADLARVAHFSPYHFHRLFSAWVGEPLGAYLRRRRLACGAYLMASRPSASVLEIALEVGFGSGEAFSRAFKQHFSVSPSTWRDTEPKRWHRRLDDIRERRLRELRNPDQTHIPAFDDPDAFIHLKETAMKVTLQQLPATRVAYLRYIGAYGPGIGIFWRETAAPWMLEHQLFNRVRYGIGHDDPDLTPADKCRYDACVEVPEDFKASAPRGRHHPARRPLRRGPLPRPGPGYRRRLDRTVPRLAAQERPAIRPAPGLRTLPGGCLLRRQDRGAGV